MVMLILWVGYRIGRGKRTGNRRLPLLAIYALSLTGFPLLLPTPSVTHIDTPALPHSTTPTLPHSGTPTLPHSGTPSLQHSVPQALLALYLCGVGICLLMTGREFWRIRALCRGAERRSFGRWRVYVVDRPGMTPFSLGRSMVVDRADADSDTVMSHEAAHLRRRHSADMLMAQAVAALCWYCPAAWLLRSELKLVHEFQADADVIGGGADVRSYSMMLVSRAAHTPVSILVNNFNTNNLKLRIQMMQSPLSTKLRPARVLLPAAALLGAVMLSATSAVTDSLATVSHTTLLARGLNANGPDGAFVIYGADLNGAVISQGNFPDADSFRASGLMLSEVDGVLFTKAGAIFTAKPEVLKQLTANARKYLIDGDIASARQLEDLGAQSLSKVIIADGAIIAYTTSSHNSRFTDYLSDAINANN